MISRIKPIQNETASEEQQRLLASVKQAMGGVPNLISTMAHSSAVAQAYLGFSQALSKGSLPPPLREQLALAVGEANSCHYCVSAHSVLGAKAGLCAEEIVKARKGTSKDAATAAALAFARKVVQERGHVNDADVEELRRHGYNDAGIAEIVAHVAMNIFTNYFNHVAGTEVDFPPAPAL